MLASTNNKQITAMSTKLGQNLYDPKILDQFDYGTNWTQAT